MKDWILEYCERIHCTLYHFFRCAYFWRFHHDADVTHDVHSFHLTGEIPRYVETYVEQIRSKK